MLTYSTDLSIDDLLSLDDVSSIDNYSIKEQVIFPKVYNSTIPSPSNDMPEDAKDTYNEAVSIIDLSPRASAALARLATQQLIDNIVPGNGNLNDKIGKLVQNGLPEEVQRMLDSLRVIGNNSVHPGQIDFTDKEDALNIAKSLLIMLNTITSRLITEQKELDKIYDMIPDGAKKSIVHRDNK
ncbi:DUF4145 domain-containing protein [Lentilactobacillus sp. SPB1-3]|uniref:DUF4145 domain-containing protein n=1 Tax=Lentilactobacillus terminaliae TaxID=3003483 RepID=A0ACD5DCY5_9LACO|nr:DUF4145 domain-containing protein [Lentilactobacillus sp. SPB1-3]MCZ0978026.1 DUF4145 domain-containing protein [Lentilactobacillus sp. SPB1-3]